jgi:hypothetical protein
MGLAPVGLPDFPLPSHTSLLSGRSSDIYEVSLAFLMQGLDRPDEALFCFGRPGIGDRLLREMETRTGRDLTSDHRAGRIVLGHSDPDVDQQLENVIEPLETMRSRGFALVRFVGIVAWNVPEFPPPEDFLWFESRLNEVLGDFPVACLCPYDVALMPAKAIAYGALEAHPFVLSDGTLRRNPQFMPPDRYMRERLLRLPWLGAGQG